MAHPIRIVPLGGLGEVGKNMMVVEHGDDIVVIDAGLMFPKEDMHGVDLVLADTTYLLERKERVRAILITHGHEDHVGGLPFLLRDLNVPIYAPPLAKDLIQVKLKEGAGLGKVDLHEVQPGDSIELGSITAEFFRVCHSIPDACGIALHTDAGVVVHSGDFKIDHTPVDGRTTQLHRLAELGQEGVLLLLSDSGSKPGITPCIGPMSWPKMETISPGATPPPMKSAAPTIPAAEIRGSGSNLWPAPSQLAPPLVVLKTPPLMLAA